MKPQLFLLALSLLSPAIAYERLQGPTELLLNDKAKAFSGYTLFGVGRHSYLIDMEGRVVHSWPIGTNPHLLDDGHILDATKDDPSGFQGFKELDWDGKTVWEYAEKRAGYAPHHDWVRIYNKALGAPTTLYIANKSISAEQAIAAGADPKNGPYADGQMDAIVEVDLQGNVVWEWCFFDHVIQDIYPAKANYVGAGKSVANHPGRININMPGRPLRRDWLHCNSLDYNAETGHLVINSVQGELYVLDHDGTFVPGNPQAGIAKAASAAGDFLYRFGDPARYGQGEPPRIMENWDTATSGHKQMGGAHDAHWIRPGLPGAGHLMVFNNGQYLWQRTPQSSVLEINPFLDASGKDTGHYINPPDAGYRRETYAKDTHNPARQVSRQIVWSFRSLNSHGFFSHIGSSAQRLPNGSTFICSDTEGHLFEITADGSLAWEYINPLVRGGATPNMGDSLPMTNSVFRAYRYAANHPALAGRSLEPQGPITALVSAPKEKPAELRPTTVSTQQVSGKNTGERRKPNGKNNQASERTPRKSEETGTARQPWPVAHAKELDTNHDGVVSREEMIAEVEQTFSGYDQNHDGKLSAEELKNSTGVRTAMGGFVRQHSAEIDANSDGSITKEELQSLALRMLDRVGANSKP